MKSLLVLILAIFMIAVIPYIYAEDEFVSIDPKKICIMKYLSCKDECDYFDDKNATTRCKSGCNKQFTCRPENKKYKIPSLYE